ncbi:microviridin precursor [Nostoc piscinale CENA21]|uniref:Microviridin n=1 Tax=Nostoc piscinale CENA21 TaxID=224013 RepID=A0A0M3V6U4_9NOSO|nr:microviridin/marinostatin family tricyclic proteinase inhibitor [Nostoc piscinale]ALF56253.1 microviridin precursor [Nostoc piscinale CENA21]
MSTSTTQGGTLKVVPFFAYFLAAQPDENPPVPPSEEPPPPPPIWTFKWPSDWEDS